MAQTKHKCNNNIPSSLSWFFGKQNKASYMHKHYQLQCKSRNNLETKNHEPNNRDTQLKGSHKSSNHVLLSPLHKMQQQRLHI